MAAFPKQLIQAVLKKNQKNHMWWLTKAKLQELSDHQNTYEQNCIPMPSEIQSIHSRLFMRWDTKHMKMSGITIFMLFCIPVGVVVVCTYLYESSIVIILPVEVEIFDANTWRVSAGQQNRGAIHCFDWRHFTCGNFQSTNSPYA